MATLKNSTIPDGGTLGSVSDPDAISISAGGSVTFSQDINPNNFVGMIAAFATDSGRTGWLVCDGAAVSRTTYASLYSVIGTTWGAGNGTSTFNVPDLRGAYLRGIGTAGVSSDYTGPATVGSYQNDQNASHNHPATSSSSLTINSAGDHRHNAGAGEEWPQYGYPEPKVSTRNHSAYDNNGKLAYTSNNGAHTHGGSVSTSTSIEYVGGTEVRVYNRGVQYFIKF